MKAQKVKVDECLITFQEHSGAVLCCAIWKNSLYSGSRDRCIRRWQLQTGALERSFAGHTNWVEQVVPVEGLVVSGSIDGTVRAFDTEVCLSGCSSPFIAAFGSLAERSA